MNKAENKTGTLVGLLIAFYILWKMPIVALYSNTYMVMGIFVVLTLLLLFNSDLVCRFPILFVAVFFYLLLMIVNYMIAGGNLLNNVWSMFLEIFPIFIGYILVHYKMNKAITIASWIMILAYSVTALTTIFGLQKYPEASRLLATGGTHYALYFKWNIGGYAIIYTMVLLHPMVVYLLRQKRHLFLSTLFSVIIGICIFESAYTIAAILFLCSCISYLFPVHSSAMTKKSYARICIFIAILVLLLIFLPQILRSMTTWNVTGDMTGKINDLANMLEGNEASEEGTKARQAVYMRSLEAFMKSPLFGTRLTSSQSGGHSFVLDTLANWGLVGFSILAFLYYQLAKFSLRIASNSTAKYCVLLSMLMSILLSVLNTGSWTFVLGFAIPVFAYQYNEIDHQMNMPSEKEGTTV